MNNLHEKIREAFIRATDGKFLEWPVDEQETAIRDVAAKLG